jgi:acyl-homoserine lactone acylase PvdQ
LFSAGPSQRQVAQGKKDGVEGVSALPGGISGVLGSPLYTNLLPYWLVNQSYDQWQRMNELQPNIESVTKYVP